MLFKFRRHATSDAPRRASPKRQRLPLVGLICVTLLVASTAQAQINEPIQPLPIQTKLDAKKVALGKLLFNDKRLSRDNSIACASCHNLTSGADGLRTSVGLGGAVLPTNAPTVFNSSHNFRQRWDGKAPTLEALVSLILASPQIMDNKWPDVVAKFEQDSTLVAQFKQAYPDGVKGPNIAHAIAEYERSLTTPNARFDKYLRGDKSALTVDEVRGYERFKSYGCVACHQGVNVGGNMFQKFGVMGDYFAARGNPKPADLGRYNVTKDDADKHVFKVPSLRNVALTAPYFHDGSASTLEAAVAVMFKYQLGRDASAEDRDLIVKFLHTLTGELDGKSLAVAGTRDASSK